MKVRALFTTLAASLLFAGAALAAEVSWNTYRDSQAGFSVEMPGEAKISTQKEDRFVYYYRYAEVGNVGYCVMSMDAGEDLSGSGHAQQLLDMERDQILKGQHATAQSERELELNGFPGREIAFKSERGAYCVSRIYVVKSHLFIVSTKSTESGTSADATRFFNSFHPELKTPAAS